MTIMELGALGEFISGASHHRPDIDPPRGGPAARTATRSPV